MIEREQLYLRRMKGAHLERTDLHGLVPELLRTGEATLLWRIQQRQNASNGNLRAVLEKNFASAQSVSVHRISERIQSGDKLMKEMSVDIAFPPLERLEDPKVLLQFIVDYAKATQDQHLEEKWSNGDRQLLVEACYEHKTRKLRSGTYQEQPMEDTIIVASQLAEFLLGKILTSFVQESSVQGHIHVLSGATTDKFVAAIGTEYMLKSTHLTPFSCTLYHTEEAAVEEYDAVVRYPSGLLCFDITCSPRHQQKLDKTYRLPAIRQGTDIAIMQVTQAKCTVREDREGMYLATMPIFKTIRSLGASIYEQCQFGEAKTYKASIQELGWGRDG